ncbi:MAG: ABC transporter ATP-binding protein [Opitutales bacterium]|jgi:NitT/TauT family transport system ATP-binding protein|nr:ABC transporter ATP-binding protein [Opitutales bacterium]
MVEENAIVQLKKLSKRFDQDQDVLSDIDLEVKEGEFISFVGPSGCGKSTLLRMLAGLTSVSEGALLIDGATPTEPRDDLYLVFQEANLLPWARVRENVELPMKLQGKPKITRQAVADAMVELVGLQDAADRFPRQLSGGMKMRVSIARALSVSPRILLLDEPFGALDAITRNQLNEDLLKIREKDPFTAFFVTHSVAEAVFLSTRIVVLESNPGRIADIIDVPHSYPRTVEFRESPEYFDLLARTSKSLRQQKGESE